MKIPSHYIPKTLRDKDRKKQKQNIRNTQKAYKKGIYINRPKLHFQTKTSSHILKAKKMYGVDQIVPSRKLARLTKCSSKGLKQITKKGRGAYYSSGSRPNQTAQSWARARLASSITGAKASMVDYHILEKECNSNSPALKLAKKRKNKSLILT